MVDLSHDKSRSGAVLGVSHFRLSLVSRKRYSRPRDVRDRVCARCGAEYEWGVHVAAYAKLAELTPEQTAAIADPDLDDAVLTERDRLLVAMVDELHDTCDVSDSFWQQLA